MSEHSIEELKRQYDAATARARDAAIAQQKAAERLHAAEKSKAEAALIADGLVPGKAVVNLYRRAWNTKEEALHGTFLLVGVAHKWGALRTMFSPLKINGEPSLKTKEMSYARLELVRLLPTKVSP